METQHRAIKGYRELTESEIRLMNHIKDRGVELGGLIDELRMTSTLDQRWVSIGETHLQEGLMALTRAVAKPTFFVFALMLGLTACTPNMTKYMEAVGKDPANVCVAVSTPYGGGVIGRVNTPGAKLNTSGGQCAIEVTK